MIKLLLILFQLVVAIEFSEGGWGHGKGWRRVEEKLTSMQVQLDELESITGQLNITTDDLETFKKELNATTAELQMTTNELETIKGQLNVTTNELETIKVQLNETTFALNVCKAENGPGEEPDEEVVAMVVLGGYAATAIEVLPFGPSVADGCVLPPYPLGNNIMRHSAFLYESKLTVCGGQTVAGGQNSQECNVLDPASGQWTHFADMSSKKSDIAVVSGSSGLMVTGGGQNLMTQEATIEKYDPVSNSFVSTGLTPMPIAVKGHCAIELDDGNLAIIGGDALGKKQDVQLYDVQGDSWSSGSNMRYLRAYFGCAKLECGKIFVAGSSGQSPGNSEIYDVATDSWAKGPDLPMGYWDQNEVVLMNGIVLIVGGAPQQKTVWTLSGDICTAADPTTLTWANGNQLIEDRSMHTATMVPKSALPSSCLTENK